MAYWLMKSEPHVYPWDKLVREQRAAWDGVRNHQAAANLRAMRTGDEALFYHSGDDKAVIGIMKIVKPAYPDPGDDTGKFVMVDVAPVRSFTRPVTLREIKADKILGGMAMVRQSRLSVSKVTDGEWRQLLRLEQSPHD